MRDQAPLLHAQARTRVSLSLKLDAAHFAKTAQEQTAALKPTDGPFLGLSRAANWGRIHFPPWSVRD